MFYHKPTPLKVQYSKLTHHCFRHKEIVFFFWGGGVLSPTCSGFYTIIKELSSQFIQKKSNKMQQCIKMYYSIFIWSSTCFGRHTAHYQEPKTALAVSSFAYVKGCWTLRLLPTFPRYCWVKWKCKAAHAQAYCVSYRNAVLYAPLYS